MIGKGVKKDEAIFQILRDYVIASKKIRFEGNGYGQEWVDEALSRGLKNIRNTPEALDAVISEQTIELMKKFEVLSERELHARHEIQLEHYTKKIQIESRVMGDLAMNHIIPTAIAYQSVLSENVARLRSILSDKEYKTAASDQIKLIMEISERMAVIRKEVASMVESRRKANGLKDAKSVAMTYLTDVVPHFDRIRYQVDKLELTISDELWPLPKYREMLFSR